MNPSPAAITAIQGKITDWTPTNLAIATALNTPSIANPVAQGQVSVVLDENTLGTLLTDPTNNSVAKLIACPNYGLIQSDILSNNHPRVLAWAVKLAIAGVITSGEESAIIGYASSTIADPAWQSFLSWSTVNIGRSLDQYDIAAARPNS